MYYEFYEQGGKQSIHKDGWKLLRLNLDNPASTIEELYFLPDNRSEKNNILTQYPEKVRELKLLMSQAHAESKLYTWGSKDRKLKKETK